MDRAADAATACAAVVAFMATYLVTVLAGLPRVFYAPVEHRFSLVARSDGAAMGYFGIWIWATLAAVVVAGVTRLAVARRERPLPRPVRDLGLVLAVATSLSAIVFFAVAG